MKKQNSLTSLLVTFLVITACITILAGILGMLFLPDIRFGYEAFFSPPFFGFLSTLTGIVTKSGKELSVKQMLFREFLQLLLIEMIVFGANFLCGNAFDFPLSIALALGIAVVFVLVYLVIWLNDRRLATAFNKELLQFQQRQQNLS